VPPWVEFKGNMPSNWGLAHRRSACEPSKQNRPHQWWRRFDYFTEVTRTSEYRLALRSPAASA